jgi:hypothetical protein
MGLPAAARDTALRNEEIRSRDVSAGAGSSLRAGGAQARRAVVESIAQRVPLRRAIDRPRPSPVVQQTLERSIPRDSNPRQMAYQAIALPD